MKKALIVIDMQNDFISGSLGSEAAKKIVPLVKQRIKDAAKEGCDIIFTRDTHNEGYCKTQEGKKLPLQHCLKGTEGWQIAHELDTTSATIFDKQAFGSTELGGYMRIKGYHDIELCGVVLDICVISNALLLKAYCPETTIKVNIGCSAASSNEALEASKLVLSSCQIDLI